MKRNIKDYWGFYSFIILLIIFLVLFIFFINRQANINSEERWKATCYYYDSLGEKEQEIFEDNALIYNIEESGYYQRFIQECK